MKEDLNIDREMLFLRYCSGMATTEEITEVEKMIAGSSALSDELDQLSKTLKIQSSITEMESVDIPAGYIKMKNKIRNAKKKKPLRFYLLRMAAIFSVPLLISTLAFGYMAFSKQEEKVISYMEVTSAPGLVSCFELPDRSKVWLNSGSTLRYPTLFDDSAREVELTGEGYFEVESDQTNPFYVTTKSGIKVMAHGTEFNVNTHKNNIETVLAEGKIDVIYANRSLQQLKPGEQALFDMETKQLSIREVNVYEKIAWKDGKIIFRNAPLDEVFDRLSERYNVDIVLHDHHQLSDRYRSRVTFTDETIQQIFTYLSVAAPIEWKISTPIQNSDSTLTKQRIEVWLMNKK